MVGFTTSRRFVWTITYDDKSVSVKAKLNADEALAKLEALDSDLDCHELSMADYEVLAQLSDAPDRRMRMSELADVAMLSRSRLSHRIKVMEKAGWVKREACPDDKRGYFVVMTAKVLKAIVAAAPEQVESVRSRFIDHLSKDDQKVLSEIFERVTNSLKANPPAEK